MRQQWLKIWNSSTGLIRQYSVAIGNNAWTVYGNGGCKFDGKFSNPSMMIFAVKEIRPEDWLTLPKEVREKIIELFDRYYNSNI